MKKSTLFLIIFLGLSLQRTILYAQTDPSPAVKQLRSLIESAKTDFKGEMGELITEDKESKINYYKTLKKTAGAQTFIFKSNNAGATTMYVINYDTEAMDTQMLGLVLVIVGQYINELNVMVKSGLYTGRDYTDEKGMVVTDIKDLNGKYILRYQSNKTKQNIYIYGEN